MKFKLSAAVMLSVAISSLVSAQTTVNNAYAITSQNKGAFEWTEVKLIDLSNGQVIKNIFENNKGEYKLYNGRSAKQITVTKQNDSSSNSQLRPFAGLSAACAYDKKRNRLYYAPIYINELRYIDLNSNIPAVYIFNHETLSSAKDLESEENHITRMVIAGDGNGYALNNGGTHLVRFTTGEYPVITDLGPLNDAPENKEILIHDANTSWGGDMLADASGSLYVISAHNHVFKINVQTRTAAYVDKIKALPEGFTTNGAVVDGEGKIVLSSANFITSYYKVDPSTWEASPISSANEVYNTSDLANDNLLFRSNLAKDENIFWHERISIYPNPVKSNSFKVTFENKESGGYNIQLVDLAGRMVSDKAISIYTGKQVTEVRVNPSLSKGMYMVKVLNHQNKEVFTRKIILD